MLVFGSRNALNLIVRWNGAHTRLYYFYIE